MMNGLLNERTLRELDLKDGERILDLGSGTGQFSRLMARAVGDRGHVVGIERDADQLLEAKRLASIAGEEGLVDFRMGDATSLHLESGEWGSFDVVHARFLLEHVRRPEKIVEYMMAAARPGGKIVLADDDHEGFRLWPEPVGFTRLWRAYMESYVVAGNDPLIGRRLVDLLQKAGAARMRNTSIFFGGCAGNDLFDAVVENLVGVIRGAREALVGSGLIDAEAFDLGLNDLRRWEKHPSATLWYYVCWAEGLKSAAS